MACRQAGPARSTQTEVLLLAPAMLPLARFWWCVPLARFWWFVRDALRLARAHVLLQRDDGTAPQGRHGDRDCDSAACA